MSSIKQKLRTKRHNKIRAKVSGSQERLRICVFRSNHHLYVQFINDKTGKTLASLSDASIKSTKKDSNLELAKKMGEKAAKLIVEKGYSKGVFDRAGYKYHGRVKALAEGLRQGGLVF